MGRAEGQDHSPCPAGHTLSNTSVMSHPERKGEPGITDAQGEFNIFVNDRDEGRECTLSRFAGDTMLSGAGCPLRDLDRPKGWPVGAS